MKALYVRFWIWLINVALWHKDATVYNNRHCTRSFMHGILDMSVESYLTTRKEDYGWNTYYSAVVWLSITKQIRLFHTTGRFCYNFDNHPAIRGKRCSKCSQRIRIG